jgi:hypothetical protein
VRKDETRSPKSTRKMMFFTLDLMLVTAKEYVLNQELGNKRKKFEPLLHYSTRIEVGIMLELTWAYKLVFIF